MRSRPQDDRLQKPRTGAAKIEAHIMADSAALNVSKRN